MATAAIPTPPEETNADFKFASYAKQIDSALHPDLVEEKQLIRLLNAFAKAFAQDELIVVGSSVDGSKVNVPGDYGDIDILLLPTHVKLDQDFMDYSERYPAFLHVRVQGPHEVYFKNIKLVNGKYLPVASLKALKARFYGMVNIFVNMKRHCRNMDELSYINHSAVGFENVTIDASEVDVEFPERKRTSAKAAIELFCQPLNTFIDLAKGGNKQVQFEEEDEHVIQSERNKIPNTIQRVIEFFSNDTESEDEEQIESSDVFLTPGDEEETPPIKTSKLQADITNVTPSQPNDNDTMVAQTGDNILENATPLPKDSVTPERKPETDQEQEPCDLNNKPPNPQTRTENEHDMKLTKLLSADYVPVFPMKGWPIIADEWLSRKRHWPTQETIDLVKCTGCHIVSKRPLLPEMKGDPKNEDHSPEHDAIDPFFRVSFSQCELILSKSLSEPQLECWRVLKAFQKAYLHTEPRVLASYHWKNVVFKVFEETEPEFWTETSILKGVQKALDLMIECLGRKFVPLYFVPTCNLIEGCREDLIAEVRVRVVEIRNDPLKYLQHFISNPPPPDKYKVEPEKLQRLVSNETEQTLRKKTVFSMSQMLRNMQHKVRNDDDAYNTFPADFKNAINTMEDVVGERHGDEDIPHAPIFQGMNAFADSLFPSEDAKPNPGALLDTFDDIAKSIGGGEENHPLNVAVNEVTNIIKTSNKDDSSDDEPLERVSNILGSVVKFVQSVKSNRAKRKVKKTTTNAEESPGTSEHYSSHTPSLDFNSTDVPHPPDGQSRQEMDIDLD